MKKPTEAFSTRFAAAKRWRDLIRPHIEDTMMFCCPGREFDFQSSPDARRDDETQVFTSLGEECATDLAGDLVTYYTPDEVKWSEFLVTADVPDIREQAVLDLVTGREEKLADIISMTNYRDIAPALMFEAASHGTPALWVSAAHIMQPIHYEVVPPNQLYITPGHLGILDRFREVRVQASTLAALFQGYDVDLAQHPIGPKMEKADAPVVVIWGFWVDWKDPGNPLWRCEITVDKIRVTPEEPITLGPLAGACPLLVGRFNPQTGKPWGRGPGMKALPDMRVLDKISDDVLAGMDQAIKTTILYADDGFLDLSEGIDHGRAYPASRGFRQDSVVQLNNAVNLDHGWFAEERVEARVRTSFYQDGPRQRGDTPPTAAQWLDERRRVQARLGKPSAPLWTELFGPMVQRTEFLAVQLGLIPDAITLDGTKISVQPISPLQKAQNQDKVMVTRSNLDLCFTVLQDKVSEFVDMPATLGKIKDASGDDLLILKKEQDAPPAPAQ